jgi:hypothetical protein
MSPMTFALIDYWHKLPAESPAARRKLLDTKRDRVRSGCEPREVLLPFALGDVDDGIVAAATQAYAAAGVGANGVDAACDATDWVRRGLALNRGAVFGALLALEDERALERLAALRLVLSANEVEAACRVLGAQPASRTLEFLQDWADLVADGPLHRERAALRAVIAGEVCARAA